MLAEKVTDAPAHIGLFPEVIEVATEGVTVGLTVIVVAVLVAVDALVQATLEVNIHVTVCPFVKAELEKEELFVPTLEPFTCH